MLLWIASSVGLPTCLPARMKNVWTVKWISTKLSILTKICHNIPILIKVKYNVYFRSCHISIHVCTFSQTPLKINWSKNDKMEPPYKNETKMLWPVQFFNKWYGCWDTVVNVSIQQHKSTNIHLFLIHMTCFQPSSGNITKT
jgi:hypothetical protein